MSMKRLSTLIVTVLVLALVFTGCSKSNNQAQESSTQPSASTSPSSATPDQPREITITGAYDDSKFEDGYTDIPVIKQWEKDLNMKITWKTYPSSTWDQVKGQMLASGDLPEIIAGSTGSKNLSDDEINKWVEQGLLLPLDNLIEEHMPRLKQLLDENPMYKKSVTSPDGKIYSFPTMADIDFGSRDTMLYVNRKWMEEAGYNFPIVHHEYVDVVDHNFTTEEFTAMLKKFKEQHPDGVPFTHVAEGQSKGGLQEVYGTFGLPDTITHIIVQNGKVMFTADKPEWKEATKYFHELYQAGLMDKEYFTQKGPDAFAKISANKAGSTLLWTGQQVFSDITSPEYWNWVLIPPLVGPSGEQMWNYTPRNLTRGATVLTIKNKNPELAAELMDYLYQPDNSYQLSMGPFDDHLTKNADGTYTMHDKPESVDAKDWANFFNSMFITTREMNAKINWSPAVAMTIEVGHQYESSQQKFIDKGYQVYPNIPFTDADNQELAELKTNIIGYIQQMQAQWITKGNIDAEWDAYVKKLNDMGLEKYVEIYQKNFK